MGRETICPKTGLKKGPWTEEEDRILTDYITIYGHGNWCDLPKNAGISRCRKSCRLRWLNYLQPNIKRGDFTKEEEELIMKMQEEHGNRWTLIAASLPGRTDNEIKNFWYSQDNKRKKLIKKALKGSKRKLVKKRSLVNGRPLILESSLVCPVSSPESTDISSPRINDSETLSDVSPRIDDREILSDGFVELDESFWEEVFKGTDASTTVENGSLLADSTLMLPLSPVEEAFDFYDVYSDAYDMDMLFNDLEFVENRQ